jgi:hypothetical protein
MGSSTSSAPPDLPEFETLGPAKGCGKIDILFVIDDGGGILEPQSKIESAQDAQDVRESTNSFIAAMQDQVADYDLQVMVVKGDRLWGGTNSSDCCVDAKPCDELGPYPCGPMPDSYTACDSTLGAGVRYPAGFMASNRDCELAGGHRYITAAQDDFATTFDCIINVGRTGGVQRYLAAMVKAVGPTLNAEGGCNAGFVRPDAMLVVVIIADTMDDLSPGTPEGLAASLVAAKAGYADGVVVVGVLSSVGYPGQEYCGDALYDKSRQFVEGTPHHVLGSYCAPDMGAFLSEALGVIQTACENFTPPG